MFKKHFFWRGLSYEGICGQGKIVKAKLPPLRKTSQKKSPFSFGHCPTYPPSSSMQIVQLFHLLKNVKIKRNQIHLVIGYCPCTQIWTVDPAPNLGNAQKKGCQNRVFSHYFDQQSELASSFKVNLTKLV